MPESIFLTPVNLTPHHPPIHNGWKEKPKKFAWTLQTGREQTLTTNKTWRTSRTSYPDKEPIGIPM